MDHDSYAKIVMRNLPVPSLAGVVLAAFISCSPPASAVDSDSVEGNGIAPLFASHTPLQVRIEAPLTTLMKERPNNEYLEGTFSYSDADGTEHVLDLKLRTRGNFRREKETCNFAPIRLNFRKKQLTDTVFAGQDKLKLVTHCQDNLPSFEQRIIREYLAYRILQVMTDKSFSTRLMHITYVDNERDKSMTKYAFVIEDDDDVAERNGMESVILGNISHDDLDSPQENLVNVFQYMIGHTDFSLVQGPQYDICCHNAVLLSESGGPPFIPMPYDFDFSGLVDAPYAAANPRFELKSVRQRLFRGECSNNEFLPNTVAHFLEKKETIYAIIDELDMFRNKDRGSVTRYLDSFFEDISQAEIIRKKFIDKCN